MSNNQTADNSNPTYNQFQSLSDLVTNDYLAGPDHEAEPDLASDARFKRFILAFDDDPVGATIGYFIDKEVAPEVHQFLTEFGMDASFADLWATLGAKQSQ